MTDSGRLRFCIVSTFYPPYNFGGDGIYAHRLANGLARLGHLVTVIHSPSAYMMLAGRPPQDGYNDHANVTVKGLWTPLGKVGLLAVHQTGRPCLQGPKLRAWLHREDFDVIHYNNVSLLGGPHVFRYGRGLKLCTLIEHWLVCPMHVLWKFDREVCTKPSCLTCTLHGRRPPQLWRYTGLMRRATRAIDAFIGPSLFTMEMHRERGIAGRMVQLPLFHSRSEAVETSDGPINEGRPYFLFVGRLEKIKGAHTIIPTFRALPDFDLLLAGSGTYEAELRAQAAGASNIKFLGKIPTGRLPAYYRSAIATVVPSQCYETFGVIVAESFSTATPVVVYAQSSLEEIVLTHGGGLLYRTDEQLRSALVDLHHNREMRDRLGRQGLLAYDTEFAEAPFLRHYMGVVCALLEEKREAGQNPPIADRTTPLAGRPVVYG